MSINSFSYPIDIERKKCKIHHNKDLKHLLQNAIDAIRNTSKRQIHGGIHIETKSNYHRYKMSTTKVKKSELNPDLEKVLENVESGKESLTKYKNFDEYIKHAKKVLED